MARWWTADQHYGHGNILEYSQRPFGSVGKMNRELTDRWNDVVAAGDEVWVLGDLVFNRLTELLAEHVSKLKGDIVLIPGNHDVCWHGHRKGGRQLAAYQTLGGVSTIIQPSAWTTVAGVEVQACHFPYRQPENPLRYDEHRPEDDGGWLLHGHCHTAWRQRGRQINVGVDVWDYAPVSEERIAEIIHDGPAA